ncbi:MAG: 30S ribosomal protein S12 methylthiotransferase RimO [Candidatus Marinimicrobia bacterium]|nr:30S ribosomal protein S12 methylthiotransferase RimO [Candidatus Neomarinimicrobiota bacterium]
MSDKKNINLISLGCAKNLVDSEIIVGGMKTSGLNIVNDPDQADTIIINTCGFLDQAREESIDTILEAVELKKTGKLENLIVMGCLSERYPEDLARDLPEVDRFFGTNDHRQIISYLTGKPFSKDDPTYLRSLLTPRHYAFIKIAEGCDNGCSFCSIPLMRGLQKSRSIPAIMTEAERLVKRGVKELLVIAQDTTSYGWDLQPKIGLDVLIKEMDRIDLPLEWIRLHYAHPAHLTRAAIDALAAAAKFCRYLDIPIQHASDRILKSMRRGLNSAGIRERIERVQAAIPGIGLRTTVIVGYPGETEDDFKRLYDFVEEIEFDRLGVFTYSEEEGTLAADLSDDVPRTVKDDRKAAIMDLQNGISTEKNAQLLGQTLRVIVDKTGETESLGRTEFDSPEIDNIVRIAGAVKQGQFVNVKITGASDYELTGKLI